MLIQSYASPLIVFVINLQPRELSGWAVSGCRWLLSTSAIIPADSERRQELHGEWSYAKAYSSQPFLEGLFTSVVFMFTVTDGSTVAAA